MTRAAKREIDKGALKESWEKQAADLGFDARVIAREAAQRWTVKDAGNEPGHDASGRSGDRQDQSPGKSDGIRR